MPRFHELASSGDAAPPTAKRWSVKDLICKLLRQPFCRLVNFASIAVTAFDGRDAHFLLHGFLARPARFAGREKRSRLSANGAVMNLPGFVLSSFG
jgi:hypothetical protein